MSYESFLAQKRIVAPPSGFGASEAAVAARGKFFPFQAELTRWALRRGRAALFADTGLGKGRMTLEWARWVSGHTKRPVLILTPLAVAPQFLDEAALMGFDRRHWPVKLCRDQADVGECVNVTNYQRLHRFDPSAFGGVALDESSILKSLDGKTRATLLDAFRETPFRLCATATPSPNDHTELGGHAEFLGIMSHSEMLSTFFVQDAGKTQDWRLKGHARDAFWRWVSSWGAIVKMPSDIDGAPGADSGYELPPLEYHEHIIPDGDGSSIFVREAETLSEQREARRETLEARVRVAANIANSLDGQAIVWCGLNDESEALTREIRGAVEVTGSQTDEEKEAGIELFLRGEARVLVSKSRICGFGLNLQKVHEVIFCGVDHSFEAFYQSVRRCWRFGQKHAVNVHVVTSAREGRVVASLKEKQRQAEELSKETRAHVAGYVRSAVGAAGRDVIEYEPKRPLVWPQWLKTA